MSLTTKKFQSRKKGKVVEHWREELLEADGDDVITLAAAIPEGAFRVRAVARVITTIAGEMGLTSFSLGVTGDTDRFGTGIALVAGTEVGPGDWAADIDDAPYADDTDVEINSNGTKDMTSGAVRVSIYYQKMYPASS